MATRPAEPRFKRVALNVNGELEQQAGNPADAHLTT